MHTPARCAANSSSSGGSRDADGDRVHQRVASTHGARARRDARSASSRSSPSVTDARSRAVRAGRRSRPSPREGIDNRRSPPRGETPHGLRAASRDASGAATDLDVAAQSRARPRDRRHAAPRGEPARRPSPRRRRASHAEAAIDDDRHRERERACGKRGNRAVDAVVAHAERLSSQAVQRASRGVGHGDVDLDEIRAGRKLRGAREAHETAAQRKGQRGQPSRPMHEVRCYNHGQELSHG